MKNPSLILLAFLFLFSGNIIAQIPTSWSIDSTQGVLSYEADAIYFKRPGGILKSDYQGNVIWSKEIPFVIGSISIDGNSIYCIQDSSIYRLDTAGNILWEKKFVNSVCPGLLFENNLWSVTANGNYIYVLVNQYDLNFHNNYCSVVTFDSLGSVINSWCDTNLFYSDFMLRSSIKGQQSGAWLLRTYDTGINNGATIAKIDNLGNMDTNTNLIFEGTGSWAAFGKIIRLKDSNYFVYNNYYLSFMGQWASCTKFNEQGNVIWNSTIRSTGQLQGLGNMAQINSVASDDSSNIYLFGWSADNNDSSRSIIIKLDKSGNLVYNKAWVHQQSIDPFYNNGYIYSGGGAKIFDTSFYSPCFAPDTIIGINYSGPGSLTGGSIISLPHINYSTSSVATPVSNTLANPTRNDLCLQTGSIENNLLSFRIFPNPTNDELQIDIMQSTGIGFHLEIFNQIGAIVCSKDFSHSYLTVDCRVLQPGIYFLKIQCSEWSTVEKLIVQ